MYICVNISFYSMAQGRVGGYQVNGVWSAAGHLLKKAAGAVCKPSIGLRFGMS
jgi:hypothetical protein